MATFARIQDGIVAEIIEPLLDGDGNEFSMGLRFIPEIVATLVDVSGINPQPVEGWTYDGNVFAAYVSPPLTPDQILAANFAQRTMLMTAADTATIGMADAFLAGLLDDTDATKFKAWAAYKLALSKVDCSVTSPVWPAPPAQ